MTPQELKNSILQLAIQGKLVEQRAEEGAAAELLEKILATKNAKDAKKNSRAEPQSRREKKSSALSASPREEIPDDEKPFDIPESWEWVRLGDVVNIVSARRVHQSDWKKEGIPFYRAREIAKLAADGYVDNDLYISQELYDEFAKSGVPHEGDLMVTAVGTLGKTYIVKSSDCFYYKDASVICFENYADLSPQYLKYLMESELMKNQIKSNSSGTTVATLTMVRAKEYLIPLPPLAEQKRIVAKIEELLPLIDRYEKAWSKLEDFSKRFPVDMQKSLLQLAIQGKLVEQRPEEGAGEELYRQIQAEKQRLIKSGKIKKEKPLPEITEDEVPFEIPDSWKWARLSKIAKAIVDCPHSTPKYLNRETEYCTIDTNCINEKGEIIKWRYVDAGTYQVRIARLVPQKDDIVYTREGSICRAAQLPDNKNICLGQRVMLVRCAHGMFPQFLRRMLMSPAVITKLTEQQKGIGAKHVNVSDVCNLLIPLPPLAEQKRIVAKLEELLPLCERLR